MSSYITRFFVKLDVLLTILALTASLFAGALPVLTDHNIAPSALSEYAHGKHDQASSTSVRLLGRDDDLSRRALLGPSGISGLINDIKGAAFTHISEPLYKTWQPTTEPGFFDRKMLRAKLHINERAKSTWNASKKPVVKASTAVKDVLNTAASNTYLGVKNGLVYVADTSKKMGDKGTTLFRQTGSALKKPVVKASTAVKDAVDAAASNTYSGVKNGLTYVTDTSKKMGDKGTTLFRQTGSALKKPVVKASTAVKDAVDAAASNTYSGVKNGLTYVTDTSKKMGDKGTTLFRQTGSALKKPFVDVKAWLNKGPEVSDETKFTPSGGNKIPRRPAGEPRIVWNRPMHIVPFNG